MYLTLPEKEKLRLQEIHEHWIEAEKKGDTNTLMDFCSDDIKWVFPHGEVIVGKESLLDWMRRDRQEIVSVETEIIELQGCGNLAFKLAKFQTVAKGENTSGESVELQLRGTHTWLFRKEQNDWKISLISWQIAEMP